MTAPPATHRSWSEVPSERIAEGIERQMIWGERLMICRLTFEPGIVAPVHTHPHEQITIVRDGRLRFTVAGAARQVAAGDVLHFPPGVEHGATALDEGAVVNDLFTPVREDFLPGGRDGRR